MDIRIDILTDLICEEPILCRSYHCPKKHSLLRSNNICYDPENCKSFHCELIHCKLRKLENTVCFLGPFCKYSKCPNKSFF